MLALFENLYFLIIFFVELPPFIIIGFLTTHVLVKILALLLFLFSLFYYSDIFFTNLNKHRTVLLLFILYFLSQSLSIINATYVINFLERYQNLIVSGLLFFLSLNYLNRKNFNKVIYIFFTTFVINNLLHLLIYLYPDLFYNIGAYFIHPGYADLIDFNIHRSRVYLDTYNEIFIPLLFYLFFIQKKALNRISLFSSAFLQAFISFITGFRTRLLMYIAALFSSIFIFKDLKKYLPFIILIFFSFIFVYSQLQTYFSHLNVIDRIANEDPLSKESTLFGRLRNWQRAIDIGMAYPISGAGLGQYYNYVETPIKSKLITQSIQKKGFNLAIEDPHNILFSVFAETGFFGLISFMSLIFYFAKKDISVLRKNNLLTKSVVISFWTLFIYALFNPSFTISYEMLFWFTRAAIEKLYL